MPSLPHASLPLDPAMAKDALGAMSEVSAIGPAFEKVQLITTVGSIASVAKVGISLVGFAGKLEYLEVAGRSLGAG